MRRAGWIAAVALLCAAGACGPRGGGAAAGGGTTAATMTAKPAATTADAADPGAAELTGDYECRFTRGTAEADPVPCAIHASGQGQLRLEQPGGAVRLAGTVTASDTGFRLSGEITCQTEPCASPGTRDVVFYAQAPTTYSAVVPLSDGSLLNIDLVRR